MYLFKILFFGFLNRCVFGMALIEGSIDEHIVRDYDRIINHLAQQESSMLQGAVILKPGVVGESLSMNQLGAFTVEEKTTRHSDTPTKEADHQRRRISLTQNRGATLLDRSDKYQILADPTSHYIESIVMALGRKKDEQIINGHYGTAFTGKNGNTQKSFDSNNIVAPNATGLTVAKIIEGITILNNNNVNQREARYMAISGSQLADLLNELKVGSSDFNSLQPLTSGKVAFYLGVNIIMVDQDLLPLNGASERRIPLWAKSGNAMAMGASITTNIDILPMKDYSVQAYASMFTGAARIEEAKCVDIPCVE